MRRREKEGDTGVALGSFCGCEVGEGEEFSILWAKPTCFEIPSWAPLHTDLSCRDKVQDKDIVERSARKGPREPIKVQMRKKKKKGHFIQLPSLHTSSCSKRQILTFI